MPDNNVIFYAVFKKEITATFLGNNNKVYSGENEEVDEYSQTISIYNNQENAIFIAPDIKAHDNTPEILGYSDAADNHTSETIYITT
jgi:hypothetical protein